MVLDDINKSFERNTSAITAPFDESIRNALTTLNKATPALISSVKEAYLLLILRLKVKNI
jgi:hypothetical protein